MLIRQLTLLTNARCDECSQLFDGIGWLISIGLTELRLCKPCKKGLEDVTKLSSKDNNPHLYISTNKQSY